MKLHEMTEDERSLLLFLEARAVDYAGRVDVRHMNSTDMGIAKRWSEEGFVKFGRIASRDVNNRGSNWCKLSDHAFQLAHQERRARAGRLWVARPYKTAEEARNN